MKVRRSRPGQAGERFPSCQQMVSDPIGDSEDAARYQFPAAIAYVRNPIGKRRFPAWKGKDFAHSGL